MAPLHIEEASIPSLDGKVALVTGGASGIGLGAVKILAERGARVFIFDLQPPPPEKDDSLSDRIKFVSCDVTNWSQLRSCFLNIGHVDMVFANAGILGDEPFLHESVDLGDDGLPLEPNHRILDVNLRAVLDTIKLSWSVMRRQENGGSIILTSSIAAYYEVQRLPIYNALKLALIGLVRTLRSSLPEDKITINAVAPSATDTPLLPQNPKDALLRASLPVSSTHSVGLAMVYSAVAEESRRVEADGKDNDVDNIRKARWNGRVIMIIGDQYTELEEPFADSRATWFGQANMRLTRAQGTVLENSELGKPKT